MVGKVRLWVGKRLRMLIELALSLIGAAIALVVTIYGILTINLNLATRRLFKWLPYVASYNKRLIALNKLILLDKDMTSDSERINGIVRRQGILGKNDIGYREFLDIVEMENLGYPDEIIYERIEQPTGEFNTALLQQKIDLIISLQAKTGCKIVTLKGTDPYNPTKIMAELKESIKLKLWETIGAITFVGALILFFSTLTLAILKIIGVTK